MPKLIEHVSEVAAPSQSEGVYQTPGFRAQAAGAMLNAVGEGVTQLADVLTTRYKENEAAKVAAEFSKAQAELTIKHEEAFRNADPNDEMVGQRFIDETLTPALDGLGEIAQSREGRMMYDRARSNLEASFKINTAAKQATLAGAAAVNNYLTTGNLLSNAVRANPGNLEFSIGLAQDAVPTNLDADKRLELQRRINAQIAGAAVNGMADKGMFDQAEQLLNSNELDEYIDASDKETLSNSIRASRNAAKADALAAEAARIKEVEAENEAEANNIMANVVQPDGTLFVPPDYNQRIVGYSQRDRANQGTTTAMINFGRSVVEDQLKDVVTVSDPSTYEGFRQRVGLDASNARAIKKPEVLQARADRRLSDKDFSLFMRAVDDNTSDPAKVEQRRQFSNIMTGFKNSIGAMDVFGNLTRADTAAQFLYFQQDSQEIFDRMTAAGKSLDDITLAIQRIVPAYQLDKTNTLSILRNNVLNNPALRVRPTEKLPPGGGVLAPSSPKMRLPGETAEAWATRVRGR
jgi:hypothetical protein